MFVHFMFHTQPCLDDIKTCFDSGK